MTIATYIKRDLFMKKTIDTIFKTIIIGGVMTAWAGTAAWAGVVEVSTLPGTDISQTSSVNQVSASVNYSQSIPVTPVITAVTTPSDASPAISSEATSTASSGTTVTTASVPIVTVESDKAVVSAATSGTSVTAASVPIVTVGSDKAVVSTASSGTSVTTAFSTGKTASTPVIDAVGTADSYMTADTSSSYTYADSYASAMSSSSQGITDTTPVVVAGGSTDDASAQESTTSEVGFCVLLSSSPTGTMKDITG
jgi:hypothetical protein